jgi:HPt (histidine-containing phosphotransfer) domain-containing protein
MGFPTMIPDAATDTSPPFAALLKLLGNQLDAAREVVGMFLEDSPAQIAEIETALSQESAAALYAAAHRLRGSAGHFGPTAAYDTAREIETLARAGNLAAARLLYPRLRQEMHLLEEGLRQFAVELLPSGQESLREVES